jgi:enamine deaminase RidA (YjgF/YER057c/UK114 family)
MEKILLGPGMGELDDGTAPAMSVGVATERADGVEVSLSGLVYPEGDPAEQADGIFEILADILTNDLDGRMEDVTLLRLYVREEHLTDDVRAQLHECRRDRFEAPEYPAATMVGVSDLVHEDAIVEIEAEAFVPDEEYDTTIVTPDE